MIDALLIAGERLAAALEAENQALARLDFPGAIPLAQAKQLPPRAPTQKKLNRTSRESSGAIEMLTGR